MSEAPAATSAQHCHKNSPSQGRQVLPQLASPLSLALRRKERRTTEHRIGMWLVRGLYRDSTVTKGGNEYAVLVIILYTSQFVFQYVISIIKLPKRVTNDTDSCQGVGGGLVGGRGDTEAFFPLITKLPSVRNSWQAGFLQGKCIPGDEAATQGFCGKGVRVDWPAESSWSSITGVVVPGWRSSLQDGQARAEQTEMGFGKSIR